MDKNFIININLAGVDAAGGGVSVPEGYYKGTVVDAYQATNKNGGTRIVFKLSGFEGYASAVRTTSITIPNANTKDGLRTIWRAAMESMGYEGAQLDSGPLQLNRDIFVNRPIHVYYVPGDRDQNIYDEIKMLSPSAWASGKAAFKAPATSALGATHAAPPIQAPVNPLQAPVNPLQNGMGGLPAAPAGQTPSALRNMLGIPS
jgi:hypothetical protein